MNRRIFLLGVPGMGGCLRQTTPRLNVFNWSNYIAPDTLATFERETGIRVRYAVYESNEEMLARVLSGNSGWDVVFPTHYFLAPMAGLDLLSPIEHSRLSNLRHLDPLFKKPVWDPNMEKGVPYMWGSSGILFRPETNPIPAGWGDMWRSEYRGRMTMLDDPAEVLGAALKKLGHSLNEHRPELLATAAQEAKAQKPLLRAYLNAEVRDQLVAGDVLLCQLWATTAQQAIDALPTLKFAYPNEGFPLYADCAVVLRESRRKELAHQFIDYLHRPDVNARIVSASRTGSTNKTARAMLPEADRNLITLYPPDDIVRRGEWFQALPPDAQQLRDRLWTSIKSS